MPIKLIITDDEDRIECLRERAGILESALAFVVGHWCEFGPNHGFEETIAVASRALTEARRIASRSERI